MRCEQCERRRADCPTEHVDGRPGWKCVCGWWNWIGADELPHNTRRMLQALDGYWEHYDGWNGPADRRPRSKSTAEDWWHRFEKYRARVEELLP